MNNIKLFTSPPKEKINSDMAKRLCLFQYHVRYAFTPLATLNTMLLNEDRSFYAYTSIYIFGVRIAIIQRNKPWEK